MKDPKGLSPYQAFFQSKHFVFLLLNLSTVLDLFNVTFLVSTKYLSTHYFASPAIASWTFSSYAITFAIFIGLFGRVGDIIGHDIQFIIMTFLFSMASLLCAVLDDIYVYKKSLFRCPSSLRSGMCNMPEIF